MARGRTVETLIERCVAGRCTTGPDTLIVEEPLAIRLDGATVATTMRTPGDDFELAVGFVHAEGLLEGARVRTVRYCGTGSAVETAFNVVSVETDGAGPDPTPRVGTTTSSCGSCGAEDIDALHARLRPLHAEPLPLDVLASCEAAVDQPLFASTGSVHAAASFDAAGEVLCVREDIGRHNAVDKVVGNAVLGGQGQSRQCGLFVSGRASFEIVQKAWAGGFRAVVAVSGPSALAVQTARRANLQLVGFARDGRLNVYADGGA